MKQKLLVALLCITTMAKAGNDWNVNSLLAYLGTGSANVALITVYYAHRLSAPLPTASLQDRTNWVEGSVAKNLLDTASWLVKNGGADPTRSIPGTDNKSFCSVANGKLSVGDHNNPYRSFCIQHCIATAFYQTALSMAQKLDETVNPK